MKKQLICALVLVSVSNPLSAGNAFVDGKDAISYRQSALQLIRHNVGDLGDMLQGKVSYDQARAERRAAALATLTQLPWEAFSVPGADKAAGDAKAEIWQDFADFTQKAEQLQQAAQKLQTAVKSADQTNIKAAFKEVRGSCKACHDSYKAD